MKVDLLGAFFCLFVKKHFFSLPLLLLLVMLCTLSFFFFFFQCKGMWQSKCGYFNNRQIGGRVCKGKRGARKNRAMALKKKMANMMDIETETTTKQQKRRRKKITILVVRWGGMERETGRKRHIYYIGPIWIHARITKYKDVLYIHSFI